MNDNWSFGKQENIKVYSLVATFWYNRSIESYDQDEFYNQVTDKLYQFSYKNSKDVRYFLVFSPALIMCYISWMFQNYTDLNTVLNKVETIFK